MDEMYILTLIVIFLVCIFAFTGLRMWWIMHQDAAISRKVNGLSIDMGKVKKAIREGYTGVVGQQQPTTINQNMTLEDVAEQLGFDKKELNNPLIRPLAEKLFEKFKSGQLNQEENEYSGVTFL